MNWEVYELCKEVARKKDVITYQEVGKLIGLDMVDPRDRDAISGILGEISTYEHSYGRPLLSAVVVLKDSFRPGGGFYGLAIEVGLLDADGDRETFYSNHLKEVYAYWKHC